MLACLQSSWLRFRLCAVTLLGLAAGAVPARAAEKPLTYEEDIRPIFRAYCFDCHGAQAELKGGLDLRLRRLLVDGGDSGPAIVPGEPEASYLLERIRAGEMPPGEARVPDEQIELLARWIAAGAPTARPEPDPAQLGVGLGITPEERAFWSFQPLRRPEPPAVDDAQVRTPVDQFLLAAMRARDERLHFAPEADRRILIRRAYDDLLGIPPTYAEVEAFVHDPAPDAYERLIERLLSSPHYGERWGRHWLDVAGYADSEGYTNADAERPHAYKYRDYVIRSLNADKPLDRFITEQLAGDELVTPPYTNLSPEAIEKLTATGLLRMAADGTGSGANTVEARNQTIADTLRIVSTAMLGLSVGCAQCHDHRYDPVSQRDYYRLRAIFEPALNAQQWRTPTERRISLYTDADRAKAAEIEAEAQQVAAEKQEKQTQFIAEALEKELEKFDPPLRDQLRAATSTAAEARTPEQQELLKSYPSVNITPGVLYQYNQAAADELKKYDERIAEIRARKPAEDFLRALTEVPGQVPQTFLFHRGDPQQPTEPVEPGGLTITAPDNQRLEIAADDPELPTTGRRLAYARWLTSGEHPLVARVLVNRIWMHHFGRAIVGTPDDFGRLGERPTHPELLDWLAVELVERGWSLKHLHRLMMTSAAYRQSSQASHPVAMEIDPGNSLYWRANVRRVDAEVLRDGMLAATGRLSRELYGPPVPVTVDETGQVVVGADAVRRSIYLQSRRSQPVALLTAFDAPVMEVNCTRRPSSTVATQSLMLMNSTFMLDQAAGLAERIRRETPAQEGQLEQSIERAWQLAYLRDPEPDERELARRFLERQIGELKQRSHADPVGQALTNLAQVLLSSNEFLYIE